MGRNTRKRRSPLAVRAVAASAALAIGGGGLVWANFYASAHEENRRPEPAKAAAAQMATIDCPDVGQKLTNVPKQARGRVDGELATLDQQITAAYAAARHHPGRAGAGRELRPERHPRSAEGEPVGDHRPDPLEINRVGGKATGRALSHRSLRRARRPRRQARPEQRRRRTTAASTAGQSRPGRAPGPGRRVSRSEQRPGCGCNGQARAERPGPGPRPGRVSAGNGHGGQGGNGPVAADFVDITKVQPQRGPQRPAANGNAVRAARSPRPAASTRTRSSTPTT